MNFILEFFSFILIYYRDPQEINFILVRPADRSHVPKIDVLAVAVEKENFEI